MAKILMIGVDSALAEELIAAGHASDAHGEVAVVSDLDALRALREREPHTPALLLSPRGEVADRVAGLDAGADDYLALPCDPAELLARVRALLRRAAAPPGRLSASGVELDLQRRRAEREGRTIELAPKEFDLLEYLMRNHGRPLARAAIVKHVWNERYDGLTNIVDVYVRHLRAKLDDPYEIKLIRTVRGAGYLFEDA